MKIFKYFVWNAIISCTLVLGYLFNCMNMTGTAIGILYGVILIPCYAFTVLFSDTKIVKAGLIKQDFKLRPELFFEPIWPILALSMGYKKIGIAMIIETIMTVYIIIVTYQEKKKVAE